MIHEIVNVILVNDDDFEIGCEEKFTAHKKGALHRAFSIFVFNSKNLLLLQKRATNKYHSGGLWSNTCCGHPQTGEDLLETANKRLVEEMGFSCELEEITKFQYKAELDHNLIENEIDHILVGRFDGIPEINLSEASEYKWISLKELSGDIKSNPDIYTFWLKKAIDKISLPK